MPSSQSYSWNTKFYVPRRDSKHQEKRHERVIRNTMNHQVALPSRRDSAYSCKSLSSQTESLSKISDEDFLNQTLTTPPRRASQPNQYEEQLPFSGSHQHKHEQNEGGESIQHDEEQSIEVCLFRKFDKNAQDPVENQPQ